MTVPTDNDFAVRLRKERQRLGLSQAKMGAFGGVAANAQSNYEKGARCPKSDYLTAIGNIGADVLYLLTGHRSGVRSEFMSADEQMLLDNYRVMSYQDQHAIVQLSSSVAGSSQAVCRVYELPEETVPLVSSMFPG